MTEGRIERLVSGNLHRVRPDYDRSIERTVTAWFERTQTQRASSQAIGDDELCACGAGMKLFTHACRPGRFKT